MNIACFSSHLSRLCLKVRFKACLIRSQCLNFLVTFFFLFSVLLFATAADFDSNENKETNTREQAERRRTNDDKVFNKIVKVETRRKHRDRNIQNRLRMSRERTRVFRDEHFESRSTIWINLFMKFIKNFNFLFPLHSVFVFYYALSKDACIIVENKTGIEDENKNEKIRNFNRIETESDRNWELSPQNISGTFQCDFRSSQIMKSNNNKKHNFFMNF